MAIWPFGRRKRHTIQVSPDEANALQYAIDDHQATAPTPVAEPTLSRKVSRRVSRRGSKRWSRSAESSEPQGPGAGQRLTSQRRLSSLDHRQMPEVGSDRAGAEATYPRPMSRSGSLLKKQPTSAGPKKLRKSKRQTDEVLREREIKLLSSTPIDIPRRGTGMGSNEYGPEYRRRRAQGRRADRYMSDISLSIRDSAASSLSDISDSYTYKVNAFAALTPRPVVRYVETPRPSGIRNKSSSTRVASDSDRNPHPPTSGEDLYRSRRRVNELADSLDAGTLRELLERDRRRREKKQLEDQERLRRKLQERADAQAAADHEQAMKATQVTQATEPEDAPSTASPDPVEHRETVLNEVIAEESEHGTPDEAAGTWLQDASKHSEEEVENANVAETLDDGFVPERSLSVRPSFAPSQEMGMSRTTLSPSHSSFRQSQTYGAGSTSDLSERRTSDSVGRRGGSAITSLFRRGSSRLKRHYRERFQDSSPDVSNASHESFYRVQTQSSPPPPSLLAPRVFIPTGTVKRSQSKFTEHFGDELISPPDSRLQSPDIPEQVPESSLENENNGTFLHGPTPPISAVDILNSKSRRHLSSTDSYDAESENYPLSQSLASIDSEGSWMSGQFFRRMSQRASESPVRPITSLGAAMDGPVDGHHDIRDSMDSRRASSHVIGDPELLDGNEISPIEPTKAAETWHHSEVGRRAILVNANSRSKSNSGVIKAFPSLSPISAEEDDSDNEVGAQTSKNPPPHPQRIQSMHGVICNADDE
ncbi:Uncharacterized protein PECH_006519 [Penicillium ucsense]|uniref:Uncharacterized protein n=1 Tax=Penicillium ucsense TaxID=2839758 RepID=A0A8J8WH75_9EURO|nr:Uncharacterized protein PECM_006750 [Penicillium ucsense]KAF7735615.1 Uncharacterized protein PECH_006519 [Penicillium ucsense]